MPKTLSERHDEREAIYQRSDPKGHEEERSPHDTTKAYPHHLPLLRRRCGLYIADAMPNN